MAQFIREQIENAVKSLGYVWFTGRMYDVNIVGIRNSETDSEITNRFDDWITVSYRDDDGDWFYHEYEATTDPGLHWSWNLLNPNGVAILKPGQYRSSHEIGLHQGKYEALRQRTPLPVYRDRNRDSHYDMFEGDVQQGIFGINIHRASATGKSVQIDKWSAGCQVIAKNTDFFEFMEIVKEAETHWGNRFTYTLIESKDIV